MSDELNARLRAIVGAAQVLDGETEMAPFLSDWRGRYHGRARAVVRPPEPQRWQRWSPPARRSVWRWCRRWQHRAVRRRDPAFADGAAVVISLAR